MLSCDGQWHVSHVCCGAQETLMQIDLSISSKPNLLNLTIETWLASETDRSGSRPLYHDLSSGHALPRVSQGSRLPHRSWSRC
jgi:hypothetical protein